MRVVVKALTLLAWIALVPTAAFAQAVIAGTVKDSSGAVLPGVTVEASSPALIEKVRSAASDGTGQYRIEDLRPGTYDVTFTLQGFNTFKREGVVLTGQFTAQINAELKVGTLSETITVTGETPVVDVQSARREMTITNDVLKAIPTVRSYNGMVVIVPGVVTQLNDVVTTSTTTQFPIHGGRNNEGRLMIDGLNIGNPPGGNQPAGYIADVGNAQEVSFTTAGGLAESETAGLVMNVVPKTGGNTGAGAFFMSFSGQHLSSDNFTDELKAQGLTAPTPLQKVYDLNGSWGGPIKKDKIWYFVNGRTQGNTRIIANVYYNLNVGDPTKWLYSPDLNNPAYNDRTAENVSGRVTYQATPRNKFGAFWDEQVVCRKCTGLNTGITDPPRVSPEARSVGQTKPLRVPQLTWSSPLTNKLLLDAGWGGIYYGWGGFERSPNPTHDLIAVTEQCATGCAANGGIPGLVYRSQDYALNYAGAYSWRASASYVTGRQSVKVGYQGTYLSDIRTWSTNSQNLAFRFNNGVPNQLTQYISPWVNNGQGAWHALFLQDQYTAGRLTLQGALRFDHSSSWYPEQTEGPTRFLPTALVIPETPGVSGYKDITPRVGVAYDVFGNGKTAVKFNAGKYLEGMGISNNWANANPTLRLPQTTSVFGPSGVTRTWTDANNNFSPDCNLQNPNTQDLRSTGGDFCGTLSNLAFGTPTYTNNFDPALLTGWGVRASDWTFGASVQQQILPRASVEIAYTRRFFNGWTVYDNQLAAATDYSQFSITAPSDPRLPGGGNYVVSGLYDVAPTLAGRISNMATDSQKYGDWTNHFNGVDVTLNVRTRAGWTFQGGTSSGRTTANNCAVRASLPELGSTPAVNVAQGLPGITTSPVGPTNPYCDVNYGWLTQLRGISSYTIPKVDVQFSGVFQSKPGPILRAIWAAPSSVVTQALGRAPAGNPANLNIDLVGPGQLYGDRVNQLDFRIAKILRYGHTRTMVGVDLYNALNSSAVLTYNNAFVPNGTWLQPQTVLTARLIKISAEITF